MRASFQILVFLFHKTNDNTIQFCVFKRKDLGVWQGIAGGGEDSETPFDAAKRETFEESGISNQLRLVGLHSVGFIPITEFKDNTWNKRLQTVPEYSLGIEVTDTTITLSQEHTEYKWLSFSEAMDILEWDSNKVALDELNTYIRSNYDSIKLT